MKIVWSTFKVMSTHDKKEDRLRQGYNLLYRTSRELASRFIHLAGELEDNYPLSERLIADLVDLTLKEVVKQTRWRPCRPLLMLLLEQRIRREALAKAKKAKETIRRKKVRIAAEARRKAKEGFAGGVVEPRYPSADKQLSDNSSKD